MIELKPHQLSAIVDAQNRGGVLSSNQKGLIGPQTSKPCLVAKVILNAA